MFTQQCIVILSNALRLGMVRTLNKDMDCELIIIPNTHNVYYMINFLSIKLFSDIVSLGHVSDTACIEMFIEISGVQSIVVVLCLENWTVLDMDLQILELPKHHCREIHTKRL